MSQSIWREAKDGQGRTYYYNIHSRESRWELPTNADGGAALIVSPNNPSQQNAPTQSTPIPINAAKRQFAHGNPLHHSVPSDFNDTDLQKLKDNTRASVAFSPMRTPVTPQRMPSQISPNPPTQVQFYGQVDRKTSIAPTHTLTRSNTLPAQKQPPQLQSAKSYNPVQQPTTQPSNIKPQPPRNHSQTVTATPPPSKGFPQSLANISTSQSVRIPKSPASNVTLNVPQSKDDMKKPGDKQNIASPNTNVSATPKKIIPKANPPNLQRQVTTPIMKQPSPSSLSPNIPVQKLHSPSTDAPVNWFGGKDLKSGRAVFFNYYIHNNNYYINNVVFDTPPPEYAAVAKLSPQAANHPSHPKQHEQSQPMSEDQIEPTAFYDHLRLHHGTRFAEEKICVDDILGLSSMHWNFDNPLAINYRAKMLIEVDHVSIRKQTCDLACPRYFSSLPLPPREIEQFTCSIELPSSIAALNRKSTRIRCTGKDSADSAILQAVKKCETYVLQNVSDYILKAQHFHEFVYGTEQLTSFECVRQALRTHQIPSFELIHVPYLHTHAKNYYDEVEDRRKCFSPDVFNEQKVQADFAARIENFHQSSFVLYSLPSYESEFVWNDMDLLPLQQCNWPFRVRIREVLGIENLTRVDSEIRGLYVQGMLIHGLTVLPTTDRHTKLSTEGYWNQWLEHPTGILLRDLPPSCRLLFSLYGVTEDRQQRLLGWVCIPLLDFNYQWRSGLQIFSLWPVDDAKEENKIFEFEDFLSKCTTTQNRTLSTSKLCRLCVEFETFTLPVVWILPKNKSELVHIELSEVGDKIPLTTFAPAVRSRLISINSSDPLFTFEEGDHNIFWMARHHFVDQPEVLAKFLLCAEWNTRGKIEETYRLLWEWKPISVLQAMELLDARYPDPIVRALAVERLSVIDDNELQIHLLQLVQSLKYELHHTSPLGRFLVKRAIANPHQIGHPFFWHMRSEIGNSFFCERYSLILEEFLIHAGEQTSNLRSQLILVNNLQDVAEWIVREGKKQNIKDNEKMKEDLRKKLALLNQDLPSFFTLPIDARWVAHKINPEKCKYMTSKKVPLWITFKNADPLGDDLMFIFKVGDDLRQDMLTLHLMQCMDRIWMAKGLDLRLKPYITVSTDANSYTGGVGMIEVVPKSQTIADIQGSIAGAFKRSPLDDYLHECNPTAPDYETAVENFIRSCAGYCVATFVMGIADRHNGNIMISKSGHLFHIDFGHFLGNWKSKLGIRRERSKFVFTDAMAHVMGGQKTELYKKFCNFCARAYEELRVNAHAIINDFILMESAGMPELTCGSDVAYLRDMLHLDEKKEEATQIFMGEMNKALSSTWKMIDDAIHILRTG